MNLEDAAKAVAHLLGEWPPHSQRRPELLHVEDDPTNLLIVRISSERCGIVAHDAVNGKEALEILPVLRPDLVILDIAMPGLDGWEVADWVRWHPELRQVPIMGLSAKAMSTDRDFALSHGFDAYVAKPAMLGRVVLTAVECLMEGWKRGYRARAGE